MLHCDHVFINGRTVVDEFISFLHSVGAPYSHDASGRLIVHSIHVNGGFIGKITSIPNSVSFSQTLRISNPKFTTLPDDIIVEPGIGIGLDFEDSGIKSIRQFDNWYGSYLDITNTPCTELPTGLCIDGFISIIETDIKCIPSGTYLAGTLYHNDNFIHIANINIDGYFVDSGLLT